MILTFFRHFYEISLAHKYIRSESLSKWRRKIVEEKLARLAYQRPIFLPVFFHPSSTLRSTSFSLVPSPLRAFFLSLTRTFSSMMFFLFPNVLTARFPPPVRFSWPSFYLPPACSPNCPSLSPCHVPPFYSLVCSRSFLSPPW